MNALMQDVILSPQSVCTLHCRVKFSQALAKTRRRKKKMREASEKRERGKEAHAQPIAEH